MGTRSYQGYTHSENGWPIVDTAEIVTVTVPGTTQQIELCRGDVATVLVGWMIWYHRNVEPIDRFKPRDDWGFSWDNDVPNSNHLSGTAVDINATQYPWTRLTMPADRVAKVRAGLKLFEGCIFWGRDWARVDEMHYQIGVDAARLKAFADKLNNGHLGIYGIPQPGPIIPAPTPTPEVPVTNIWDIPIPTQFGTQMPAWELLSWIDGRLVRTEITVNASIELHRQNQLLLAAILDQLGGLGTADALLGKDIPGGPFQGFEQGGGRTLYDLTSALAATAGIPGALDKKAGK
ncbi:M15 family metallopeptidase [Rhodococcus sp. T2V]|uniref:M15 family metallopeptidase n=1 Tax=Rhodococcus sp. T2V TaxID=3034164 RepID=UPI0023E2D936|nr:M15 family metallopeptidase [Rhodococcus sp. T2V]MDF3308705.1 M15 family metallopeptidase [Rhodococcus sp. T2V]